MRIIQVGNSFHRMSIMNQYNNHNSNHSSLRGSNFGDDSEEEFGTEDSDEEPEEDEEESDGCTTQALIDHVESSFLTLLDETVEKVEKSQDIHRAATNSINSTRKMSSQQFPAQAAKLSRDEETQTDTSFSPEHVISHTIGEANDVRHEIASLRLARDTLVNQRKEVADRIKKGTSKDHRLDEKKVYEYEEAIEAIDSVIEFKNEIICGRECVLSNYFAPGRTEADLVTRLSNLTTLDLQRLLWKYFLKVVEIRYSSKRLEKQIDELETQYERLNTNLNRSNKYMKDMRSEYESRIKMFIGLYSKDANSAMAQYVSHLESELQKASKRQNDLEKSVFELLVRHGYLTNTQDCDVKQVLKKLDIDANQVGLNGKPESKSKRKMEQGGELASNLRQAVEYGITNQSRRMKEAYDNRHRNHQPSHSSHNHHPRRHHRHHHGQSHGNRDTGTFDAHDFHHAPPQPAEVKRTNKKLIIQPRPNTPDQT